MLFYVTYCFGIVHSCPSATLQEKQTKIKQHLPCWHHLYKRVFSSVRGSRQTCLCQPFLTHAFTMCRWRHSQWRQLQPSPLPPALTLAHLPVITHFQHCLISHCMVGLDWGLSFLFPPFALLCFFFLLVIPSHFSGFPYGQQQRNAGTVGALTIYFVCPTSFTSFLREDFETYFTVYLKWRFRPWPSHLVG